MKRIVSLIVAVFLFATFAVCTSANPVTDNGDDSSFVLDDGELNAVGEVYDLWDNTHSYDKILLSDGTYSTNTEDHIPTPAQAVYESATTGDISIMAVVGAVAALVVLFLVFKKRR